MQLQRHLDPDGLGPKEDWEGNNVAFTCPHCNKVFLVSGRIHRGSRLCPCCGKSKGNVSEKGGRLSNGKAWLNY